MKKENLGKALEIAEHAEELKAFIDLEKDGEPISYKNFPHSTILKSINYGGVFCDKFMDILTDEYELKIRDLKELGVDDA